MKPPSLLSRRSRIASLLLAAIVSTAAGTPAFSQAYTSIVVFGDSLSDTGNAAAVSKAKYTVNAQVPGPATGYTDGRFTDGLETAPAARNYTGVWVEQLAAKLPNRPAVVNSLNGGTDYAYGFATTASGTSTFTYGPGNALSFPINNMGQQVTDYLATNPTITSKTLFIVWGGANDLINATSAADIGNAVTRDLALVQRLIDAGATDILVPNLPPLGLIPRFNGSAVASAQAAGAAQAFDQGLATGFSNLAMANAGKQLNLVFLDIYTLFNTIVGPPVVQGFANVTASAQGNVSINPDTYLFWDDIHPTTFGHSQIAAAALVALGPAIRTTTTLVSSAAPVNLKQSVTFTASVIATAGTPIGNVMFLDGATMLASVPLSGASTTATASFTTSSLAAGSHPISALYAGDNGYGSSISAFLYEVVVPPTVTTAIAPTSLTLTRGAAGSTTLTITPAGGYTGAFLLACGTLPAHFSCTVGASTLTVSGTAPVSTTVQVATNAASARNASPFQPHDRSSIVFALLGLPLLGGIACGPGRRRIRTALPLLLVACTFSTALLFGLTGCSNDPYANDAATGTYQIPLILTPSGATPTTITLNVTVQ